MKVYQRMLKKSLKDVLKDILRDRVKDPTGKTIEDAEACLKDVERCSQEYTANHIEKIR